MKKVILIAMMLLAISSYAVYNIGDTVDPSDNVYWTITGPAPYTGESDEMFNMITSNLKPVFIFFGGTS